MPKYLVAGNVRVYTEVEASNEEEAIDIAQDLDSDLRWNKADGRQVSAEVEDIEVLEEVEDK